MEIPTNFLVVSLLLSCFAATTYGLTFSSLKETLVVTTTTKDQATTYGLTFSSLKETLVVTTTTKDQVLKAGDEQVTVTWEFNKTYPAGTDLDYKTVEVKLCYAPISQKDRSWRKTVDLLKKDKTCLQKIAAEPYRASNNSLTWTIERDVPTASYFVRVYAFNAQGEEVAFGQSTNTNKSTNLFEIQAITGRHVSLDIASICFSAFSIVSLAGFFYMEKRGSKSSCITEIYI